MSELVPATVDEARRRADRIRGHAASFWEEVITAFKHLDHEALGYGKGQAAWDAYILGEFGTSRLALPRRDRVERAIEASKAGMSPNAIASTAGVHRATIQRDLASQGARNAHPDAPREQLGLDGKTYTVTPPQPTTPAPEPDLKATLPEENRHEVPPEHAEIPRPTKRRRPLPEKARIAGVELWKSTEHIQRILDDDRLTTNKEQVALHLKSHLRNTIESCQGYLDQLDQPKGQS